MRDLLIVGAGPAGLSAAAEAARLGAETVVVEEDKEVGLPEHCAGLVSLSGLREILGNEAPVIRRIKGFRIHAPSGAAYTARGKHAKAAVIDRPAFERELLRRAEAAGAIVALGTRFESSIAESKAIIIAEGTKGRISRRFGIPPPKSIPAAQLDLETRDFDEDLVEIYLGGFAEGFFAWVVPRKDGVRVGLASEGGVPLRSLEWMLEKGPLKERFQNAKKSDPLFGKVVTGGPVRQPHKSKVIAIGDAGGFVKPTTGGGVVLGCLTARLAARASIKDGLGAEGFSKSWKEAYGRDFFMMKAAMKVYRKMGPRELDKALRLLDKENLLADVLKFDMDLQGGALSRIARSPALLYFLPAMLRIFI